MGQGCAKAACLATRIDGYVLKPHMVLLGLEMAEAEHPIFV